MHFAVIADIVEIKHIMLPPSPRDFKDIYVVFELMETDLHQVRGLQHALLLACRNNSRTGQQHRSCSCVCRQQQAHARHCIPAYTAADLRAMQGPCSRFTVASSCCHRLQLCCRQQ